MARKSMLLLGGSILGAGLALLYAPYSGVKSRKKMMRFGKSMSKMSDRTLRNFNDAVSDFADMMGTMSKRANAMLHR